MDNCKLAFAWLYRSLEQKHLSVRAITQVDQKSSKFLESVRVNTVHEWNAQISSHVVIGKMDQKILVEYGSNLYLFEPKVKKIVHYKGSNKVSCCASGSNQCQATVCITVVADGTKLPPFYIFKGPSRLMKLWMRKLEYQLQQTTSMSKTLKMPYHRDKKQKKTWVGRIFEFG
jgi:hypothetical protein